MGEAIRELKHRRFRDAYGYRKANGNAVLARSDLNQSVGKPFFKHLELNSTENESVASAREKNTQFPAAVCVSKTSVIKLSIYHFVRALFNRVS